MPSSGTDASAQRAGDRPPVIAATAVGFDLDDTLFDHRGAATAAVESFVRMLDRTPSPAVTARWFAAEAEQYELWRSGRIGFQEQRRRRLRSFLPAIDVAIPETEADLDALFGHYLPGYRAAWRPFPDAAELLSALRSDGVAIGVLTNGRHEQQLAKLAAIGLAPLVDVVCTSERLGLAKPDPRAFEALAGALDVRPSELVFVGDHPEHDVAGARAAGIRAGLVERGGTPPVGLAAALGAARL